MTDIDIKALLSRHDIHLNKSLGQNFLKKTDIIENIANNASGGKYALEIGAGPGILTRMLCQRFERVVTVEIDRYLRPVLEDVLGGCENHIMIYQDFLKTDIKKLISDNFGDAPVTVVGNLPYSITGRIIIKLLKNNDSFDKAVLMVQKEAADKLTAHPSTKIYRAVSVLTQYCCDITRLFDVTPDCFVPAPNVTSSVIMLGFKKQLALCAEKFDGFENFINTVFSRRRKFLVSAFQNDEQKEKAIFYLKRMGLPENTRGEQLDSQCLASLYEFVFVNKNEIISN